MPQMNTFELAIRRMLQKYLRRAISLTDFEDWFFPVAWDMPISQTSASLFTRKIEGRLSEPGDEDALRQALLEILIAPIVLDFGDQKSLSSPVSHYQLAA